MIFFGGVGSKSSFSKRPKFGGTPFFLAGFCCMCFFSQQVDESFLVDFGNTLPETSILAPENGWLEYFLVSFWGPAYFQGRKC